jgi:hypothetical protein
MWSTQPGPISILRIMSLTRRSDNQPIEVINNTDIGKMRSSDYGQIKRLVMDAIPGPVRYGVIGMQKGKVRWVQVPEVADVADAYIYRMPLNIVSGPGQEIEDIEEMHHIHLLKWMKHLAYLKQDADAYNPKGSAVNADAFATYCHQVKAEWERYKHKTRVVSYGGL